MKAMKMANIYAVFSFVIILGCAGRTAVAANECNCTDLKPKGNVPSDTYGSIGIREGMAEVITTRDSLKQLHCTVTIENILGDDSARNVVLLMLVPAGVKIQSVDDDGDKNCEIGKKIGENTPANAWARCVTKEVLWNNDSSKRQKIKVDVITDLPDQTIANACMAFVWNDVPDLDLSDNLMLMLAPPAIP